MFKIPSQILIFSSFAAFLYTEKGKPLFRHFDTIYTVLSISSDYRWTMSRPVDDREKSRLHLRSALKLLALFKSNGGCYIKIGQHMASLAYLLPSEYTGTLSVLQDACPTSSLDSIKKVFELETGATIEEEFKDFNPVPVGAASLAQVHSGIDKHGRKVAIKIQHDYLDDHAPIDIKMCATNDLLRSIHNELGVVKNEGHLITMARNLGWNCLACIYRNERENLEWNEKIELWKIALKLLLS